MFGLLTNIIMQVVSLLIDIDTSTLEVDYEDDFPPIYFLNNLGCGIPIQGLLPRNYPHWLGEVQAENLGYILVSYGYTGLAAVEGIRDGNFPVCPSCQPWWTFPARGGDAAGGAAHERATS